MPTTRLADAMDVSKADPALQAKAAEMFPKARTSVLAAYKAGVKIAVGTDAPAIPHGRNADELVALVERGLQPLEVLRAATLAAAELVGVADRGRLAEGLLADVISVPGVATFRSNLRAWLERNDLTPRPGSLARRTGRTAAARAPRLVRRGLDALRLARRRAGSRWARRAACGAR